MGRIGKQAQGQILPAHRGWETQIPNRSGKVESHDRRDRWNSGDQAGGSVRLWSRLRSWVEATLRRSRMESEMDAEMRFHIEAYAEDLIRSGVPREEAMRRARIEFGGIERAKEECRDARGVNIIETVVQDLRYGLRMLRKNPAFTAVAVLTLALGIGANTAMFTVVNSVLLRPLPFENSGQLFEVRTTVRQFTHAIPVSEFDFLQWAGEDNSLDLAAITGANFTLTGRSEPLLLSTARVSSTLFSVLGAQPAF